MVAQTACVGNVAEMCYGIIVASTRSVGDQIGRFVDAIKLGAACPPGDHQRICHILIETRLAACASPNPTIDDPLGEFLREHWHEFNPGYFDALPNPTGDLIRPLLH